MLKLRCFVLLLLVTACGKNESSRFALINSTGDADFREDVSANINSWSDHEAQIAQVANSDDRAPSLPLIIFRNIMIIKTRAEKDDQVWEFSQNEIEAIRLAFEETWPRAMTEISRGQVALENSVVVSYDDPIQSWGYQDDMVEPHNVPGWTDYLGQKGIYDIVFLLSPKPQRALWALGNGLTWDESVGWISMSRPNPNDLGIWSDWNAGLTHEFLHIVGESFYQRRLNVPHIPPVHGGGDSDYQRAMLDTELGPLDHWWKWYKDYINQEVNLDDQAYGLGPKAWSLGNIREWYQRQSQDES